MNLRRFNKIQLRTFEHSFWGTFFNEMIKKKKNAMTQVLFVPVKQTSSNWTVEYSGMCYTVVISLIRCLFQLAPFLLFRSLVRSFLLSIV